MKDIYKEESLDIPEGVTVTIKARIITVVGPRGTLQKVRFYYQAQHQKSTMVARGRLGRER